MVLVELVEGHHGLTGLVDFENDFLLIQLLPYSEPQGVWNALKQHWEKL